MQKITRVGESSSNITIENVVIRGELKGICPTDYHLNMEFIPHYNDLNTDCCNYHAHSNRKCQYYVYANESTEIL